MSSESIVLRLSPKVRGSTSEVKIGGEMAEVCEIQITYDNPENSEFSVELPLEDDKFASLQGVIYGGHCIHRPSVYYYAVDLDL